ncbi:hypothetical protein [Microbacterium sp. ZXX196]|uniref:hypothetical protein n=1 Tax=Microbacterium sp. ZXX196 TaxID=2609291 RepID=UPI0012B896BC|nr:hypothetical protein [Microbacterium sp. ZXX196]MTE24454.1 hypothetical protein [Microbacterium sp. ZXX196]
MSGMSLREELGARPDPEFELRLPDGWVRRSPDDTTEREFERAIRARAMAHGMPDMMATGGQLLRDAFSQMREHRVVAMFLPFNDDDRGYFPVPMSVLATVRHGRPDQTLDAYVRHLIAHEGGTPLLEDKRVVRVEREERQTHDGAEIVVATTLYVTPIPGTRRQRALELAATYGRPATLHRDDPQIETVHGLFDMMVSTLRWVPPTTR